MTDLTRRAFLVGSGAIAVVGPQVAAAAAKEGMTGLCPPGWVVEHLGDTHGYVHFGVNDWSFEAAHPAPGAAFRMAMAEIEAIKRVYERAGKIVTILPVEFEDAIRPPATATAIRMPKVPE